MRWANRKLQAKCIATTPPFVSGQWLRRSDATDFNIGLTLWQR